MPRNLKEELDRITRVTKAYGLGAQLEAIVTDLTAVFADLTALRTRINTGTLNSAGLVIKAGSSAIVKAGSAFAALAGGAVVVKAANTDMSALVGTLATAKSAVWAFYIDSAGVITTSAKTADANDAAAALALMPASPDNKAMIGFIVVANASGSNFVGGTTALDAASITTTYYNTTGPTAFAAALTSSPTAQKPSAINANS